MSDHLPECPWADRGYAFPCICDRLRACEQRVFQEQIKGRQHDMVMAYLRGLDAAREAVAALPISGGFTTPEGRFEEVLKTDALAAIDALRATNP